jgi:ribonucleoside-diphosphate reductase alpha chain
MLTPVATNVLTTRYLQKDDKGSPLETIDQLWRRVARHASKAEVNDNLKAQWEDTIYNLLSSQLFLFNSPTLVNAGTAINGLSACFVVGMEDSIDGIWQAKRNFAKIAQKGGGAGINVCDLRPKNDFVGGSTHAKAGGPVAFLETFWRDMEAVTQAGFRSMACMAVCRVDHPDIEDFITCKSPARALATVLNTQYHPCSLEDAEELWRGIHTAVENGTLTPEQQRLVHLSENYLSNFNISVGITNEFMEAVKNDSMFPLHFGGRLYRYTRAKELWGLICQSAHKSGDPGLMFLDTTNNRSPYRYSGQIIKSTNPCGEQGLPPNGVCNLGSIDVSKFVDLHTSSTSAFNWPMYEKVCKEATHALNNIVDIASWPTQEIEEWVHDNRPIGLGFMGFADACLVLGMRYGSAESIEFALELGRVAHETAEKESIKLGVERGVPTACTFLPAPRRNATLLTVAPTGTISLIAGCSSGCEPVFDYVQVRQDNTGSYIMVNPAIKAALHIDDLVYPVGYDRATLQAEANTILEKAKKVLGDIFVTASDISWREHIDIQAAFQIYVDSGVSKTVNMANDATVEDVNAAYMYAFDQGCKGITIYRDGSKFFQILSNAKAKQENKNSEKIVDLSKYQKLNATPENGTQPATEHSTSSSPDIADAKRFKVNYKGDRWYVMVGEWEGKPMEVFTFTTKEDDTLATMDGLTRMISLALKNGASVEKVIEQLRRVRQYHIGTFPAIIARVLSNYLPTEGTMCTECGSTNVILTGGCPSCQDCGYSKCG